MLWLDKLALYFQILAIFFTFLVLKHLNKIEFKSSDDSYKPMKATGLAMLQEVCVESRIWMLNL